MVIQNHKRKLEKRCANMSRLHEWSARYLVAVALSGKKYYYILNPKCWLALLLFVVG